MASVFRTSLQSSTDPSGKTTVRGVRQTVATFSRYSRFVRRGIERQVERAELEIRDLARSSVFVKTGRLRRSIRRRRRKTDKDFGPRVVAGGVVVHARYGVVEEAGKEGRSGRPFFYRQLDVVGPKFDRRVAKLIAVDAIRKARPRV